MREYPVVEHENILETLVSQIRDLLNRIKNHELKQFGITLRQIAVLDIVNIIGDKATPKEISKRLLRQPHTVSSLLIKMEKQGLINRNVDPDMRINLNISLTKKGRQILEKSKKLDTIRALTSCLSEKELQELISSLKKIRKEAINKLVQINGPLYP